MSASPLRLAQSSYAAFGQERQRDRGRQRKRKGSATPLGALGAAMALVGVVVVNLRR